MIYSRHTTENGLRVIITIYSPLKFDIVDKIYYDVIPSTLGECTGLRDKNKKLIFEGDIVEIKGNIGCVIFVDDEAGFVVDTDKKYFTMSFSSECEIVGNIHDNPELISERTN